MFHLHPRSLLLPSLSASLLSNSAKAQVELTEQLLASLAAESDPGRQKEVVQASNKSLHKLSEMLDQ